MKRTWAVVLTAFVVSPCALWGQAAPELRLTRDLRIDANEHDLSPIAFVAVAPNGSIAITQQQDRHIRFFDAAGKPLGTFGRNGQGPGEFMTVGRMFWIADTLAVIDPSTRRFTLIAPNRELARTVSMQISVSMRASPGTETPRYNALPMSLGTDGSFLTSVFVPEGTPPPAWPGGTKEGTPLVRVDSAGVIRNVVVWRPEVNCSVPFDPGRGGRGFVAIPYCAMLLQDHSSDGSRVAFSWVEQGSQPSFRLGVYRVNGDTLFNRSYSYRPIRISQEAKDTAMASRSRNPQMGSALANVKLPDTYPPLARVLIGTDQTTLIEFTQPEGERTWQVLDARGTVTGQLRIPRNLRILVASGNMIWGTETDDDGVQHIVRYRVGR